MFTIRVKIADIPEFGTGHVIIFHAIEALCIEPCQPFSFLGGTVTRNNLAQKLCGPYIPALVKILFSFCFFKLKIRTFQQFFIFTAGTD